MGPKYALFQKSEQGFLGHFFMARRVMFTNSFLKIYQTTYYKIRQGERTTSEYCNVANSFILGQILPEIQACKLCILSHFSSAVRTAERSERPAKYW